MVFCWLQPLPIRAAEELLQLLALPQYQNVRLYMSCFEIYGGMCHHPLQINSLALIHVCVIRSHMLSILAAVCPLGNFQYNSSVLIEHN